MKGENIFSLMCFLPTLTTHTVRVSAQTTKATDLKFGKVVFKGSRLTFGSGELLAEFLVLIRPLLLVEARSGFTAASLTAVLAADLFLTMAVAVVRVSALRLAAAVPEVRGQGPSRPGPHDLDRLGMVPALRSPGRPGLTTTSTRSSAKKHTRQRK